MPRSRNVAMLPSAIRLRTVLYEHESSSATSDTVRSLASIPSTSRDRVRESSPPGLARIELGTLARPQSPSSRTGRRRGGCVFLLEREPGRQRSEPLADSGEGGAARWCVVLWRHAADEFERAPADGAVGLVDEAAELLYAVLSDERIRVLRSGEQAGLEHAERGRFPGSTDAFNCS